MGVYDMIRRSIPSGEPVLAAVEGQYETTRIILVLTGSQLIGAEHRFFSWTWNIRALPLTRIDPGRFYIREGLFYSELVVEITGNEESVSISNIGKSDARNFYAKLIQCCSQSHDAVSQQTKVCPDCAEIIKLLANVCRYCGHQF